MPLQPPKVEARQYRDQHVQAALKQLGSSKSFVEVLESGFLTSDIINDDETAPLAANKTEKPARFMTLKFTLTPLETREPESVIYSGMDMVLADAGAGASDNHDHDDNNNNNSEFSIPVGGFGAEPVSAKKLIIRKVFKKLNGGTSSNMGLLGSGGSSGSGVMITSSDFADKK
jgi:hypothetical protein